MWATEAIGEEHRRSRGRHVRPCGELSKSDPVVGVRAHGSHVRCQTAISLREAGADANYMKGGHSAWDAIKAGRDDTRNQQAEADPAAGVE
jgi:hypothetical protein